MTSSSLATIAAQYISEFGVAIVPMPYGTKAPDKHDWNEPGNYLTDPELARAYFTKHPRCNIGALLGASNIVSLDIDNVEHSCAIFSAFGIDLMALREANPTIVGNPERFRIWFRAPEGVALTRHSLNWPLEHIDPAEPKKTTFTVFELRAGKVQDVIPPSLHPETKQNYKFSTTLRKGLCELPDVILEMWENWDSFKKQAAALCPWAHIEEPKPKQQKHDSGKSDLIGRYNAENDIHTTLERYGYKRIGRRYLSPHSSTKLPGVNVVEGNICFIHHASDPLCSDESGRPVCPFDLYCYYEHKGDAKKAVKQLAADWGLEPIKPQKQNKVNTADLSVASSADVHTILPYTNDKGKPLVHIENLREILRRLGVMVRYNVITKDEEIIIPNLGFSVDNTANASLAWIESECSLFDFPTTKVKDFLLHIADQNQYNPVATWITSKPHDGQKRIEAMLNTIACKNPADNTLKEILMRKWFISAVAAAFSHDGISAAGMLVLQGDQGLGKTRWFKSLVPNEMHMVKDGFLLDPTNKDSVGQAVSFWLVELGELDATFRKSDIAALKAFITQKNDIYRKAYAAKPSKFARRTVFFGSVNSPQYLNDPTGNRRFWTVECESIDHNHGIDMQQFWAEIYSLHLAGESYHLSDTELEMINHHNESFLSVDPIEELMLAKLDWNEPATLWRWRTATDLYYELGLKNLPDTRTVRTIASVAKKIKGANAKRTKAGRLLFLPSIKP